MEAKRKMAEIWRDRIKAQQTSGQSIRGWCRANGCHEHGFYWWRVRLKLRPAGTRRRGRWPLSPVKFAQVIGHITEPIRLRLAGDRELVLPASMAVEQIARLVRAVEGLP